MINKRYFENNYKYLSPPLGFSFSIANVLLTSNVLRVRYITQSAVQ